MITEIEGLLFIERGMLFRMQRAHCCLQNLDPFPVHPEVGVPDAGGGAQMDGPGAIIEQELDVVHETEQGARELGVQVGFRCRHGPGPRHTGEDLFQVRHGFGGSAGERDGLHGMVLVSALARHAVERSRAGRKLAVMNTQGHGPGAGAAGNENAEGQDRRKSFNHVDVSQNTIKQ